MSYIYYNPNPTGLSVGDCTIRAILANNDAQTNALEQYLAPVPRPAYIVQNPNGCGCNTGCSCGF